MTTSTLRMAALLAMAGAGMGGAEVIQRPFNSPALRLGTSARRTGNNRPAGLTFAQKKRKRKIALASKRFNRQRG